MSCSINAIIQRAIFRIKSGNVGDCVTTRPLLYYKPVKDSVRQGNDAAKIPVSLFSGGRTHRLISGRLHAKHRRRLKLDTRGWRVSKRRVRSCVSVTTYLKMERSGVETSLSNPLHIQEGRMVFGAAESRGNSPPAQRKRHRARNNRTLHTVPTGTD